MGEPDHTKYYFSTTNNHTGELMPEKSYHEWCFSQEDDDLLNALHHDFNDGRTIPIIYYLRNDKKRALEHIEKRIKRLSREFEEDYETSSKMGGGDRTFVVEDKALKYYMEFVEKFKTLLNDKG